MEKISFDSEYVKAILEGRKRTTVRRGIRTYPSGKLVELTANGKTFALAKIRKVVVKRISELTDEDAIMDGFEGKEKLISALKKIYGNIDDREFVTIVHFDVIG